MTEQTHTHCPHCGLELPESVKEEPGRHCPAEAWPGHPPRWTGDRYSDRQEARDDE